MKLENKQFKKIALFLIIVGTIGLAQAQAVLKLGENPYIINDKAVLELESTVKGFLPPRMTREARDLISPTPEGLLIWCTDCDSSTEPASGQLCVFSGTAWTPFSFLAASNRLTTAKKTDVNKPIRVSATSATIKGTLASVVAGASPTETGVVYREIKGTDFATLPVLDTSGNPATPDTYKKTTDAVVTEAGGQIVVTISPLSSTTSSTRPYYFRTYAKSPLGIAYGNPVIFNCAPPVISDPVVTGKGTPDLTFAGTLTVNAGTPPATITEYGYYSSATNNPPTTADNKVVLSGVDAIAALDAKLNSETFKADISVDLPVTDYVVKAGATAYFRYYVIANGDTVYSDVADLSPSSPSDVVRALITKYDCNEGVAGTTTGTLTKGIAVSGVSKTIKVTVETAGPYDISTNSLSANPVNGVMFKATASFDKPGEYDVILIASGTPTEIETSKFTLKNIPSDCFFTMPTVKDPNDAAVDVGEAEVVVTDCSGEPTGTLVAGVEIKDTDNVTKTIKVNVTKKGKCTITASSSGVIFSYSDKLQTGDNQEVILKALGTPTPLVLGDTEFVLKNKAPATDCKFTMNIEKNPTSNGTAVVSNYDCSGAPAGELFKGVKVAAGAVTKTITVNVDKAGTFNFSAISNGITFTTKKDSGFITEGPNQTITLTATADEIPTDAIEDAIFTLNTPLSSPCTFKMTAKTPDSSSNGSAVLTYNCTTTDSTGILTEGTVASGVTQKIKVNVTKEGSYNISTKEVKGITFAGSGTFSDTQKGDQTIELTASGTPGTPDASDSEFNLNLANITCSFSRTITPKADVVASDALCLDPLKTEIRDITINGKKWMDRNLGANRQAESATDYKAYGCLYQWGRGNDGHASIKWTSATEGEPYASNNTTNKLSKDYKPEDSKFIIGNDESYDDWREIGYRKNDLWKEVEGVKGTNDPCPKNYRIPTKDEFNEILTKGLVGKKEGGKVTNMTEAFESLKLVAAGFRKENGSTFDKVGKKGMYWTSDGSGSTASGNNTDITSYYFYDDDEGGSADSTTSSEDPDTSPAAGLSVRCIHQ